MATPDTVTADDRARVVTAAALKAADALQINKATLGRILGLSPASVSRLAAGGELRPDGVEIEEAAWFDVEALPRLPPSVSISRRLIITVANALAQQQPRR